MMTRQNLFYFLSILILILFCNTACEKLKYKEHFRTPLVGKYLCQVQIYNQTEFHCVDKDKIKDTFVIEEVYYLNDHQLAIKPSISLSYQLKDLPYDTVNFVAKNSWGIGDSILVYYNYNNNRISYLAISDDSLYSSVLEPCRFNYEIRGKKIE